MISKIIEVENGFNWGKFLVAKFDDLELSLRSSVDPETPMTMLRAIGYGRDDTCVWVVDLQTREGAGFYPNGNASIDLNARSIWVCPMYEPFLNWLYKQDLSDITKLPAVVRFTLEETAEHTASQGYRRQGPQPLTAKTRDLCQEGLARAIDAFLHNPNEVLDVPFDDPDFSRAAQQYAAELRQAATELEMDFDEVVNAEAGPGRNDKWLKELLGEGK